MTTQNMMSSNTRTLTVFTSFKVCTQEQENCQAFQAWLETLTPQLLCLDQSKNRQEKTIVPHFYAQWLQTPLGVMLAIADEQALYLLEFYERKNLQQEILNFHKTYGCSIFFQSNPILQQIRQEMQAYFSGQLQMFHTPLAYRGTAFQEHVWRTLQKITYGNTCSYSQLAGQLSKPKATRAVANANAKNKIAIVIPCHRVIGTDGSLTGYAAGLERKKYLLIHEGAWPAALP